MDGSLEEVATAADQTAAEQREVARAARRIQRQLADGQPWAEIIEKSPPLRILDLLRSGARRLGRSSTLLATSVARGLTSEGQSRRRIAPHLGITHQRVSALLKRGHNPQAD